MELRPAEGRTGMGAFHLLRSCSFVGLLQLVHACTTWLLCSACMVASAQDLSWVNGAMERSKTAQRESLPAWQFDPRVAASNIDASLNALMVVNPDRLFAVGDRGLILASIDGGRTWQAQNSLTSLNLYGVAFFNEQQGVAVGGTVQPLSQTSVGIVLVTADGGKSWQAVTSSGKAALPRLTGVSIDQRSIRVWGDYSSAHGCGIFESQDQGRTWQPVSAPLGHIQAVARQPYGMILGLDHAGRLAQIPHNPNRNFKQLAEPTTPLQSLIHTQTQWLAVGDNATITSSRDGVNWEDHALPLTDAARDVCSFRCATAFDQSIWVAGTPGSFLLHSLDAGQSWRVVPIDQAWSISAIQFVDRHRGWLVTVAGSIWATRDGGATWFAQRVPVKRLGLQAIAASASNISWPALANATWQARQATDLIAVYRENMEDTVDVGPDAPAILTTLGGQLGLTGTWHPSQWPVSGAHVQLPATSHDDHAKLVNHLAMQLRAGRPSVVLIDDLSGTVASDDRFTEAVTQAVWLAENEHPQWAWLKSELNLAPWKPTKLLSVSTVDRADFTISSEELLRDSGLAMQDVLAPIFGKQSLSFPNSCLQCLQLSTGNSASRQNIFASQDRLPETTRAAELAKIGNLQLVMGRAHRDKAWQALAPTPLNLDDEINVWTKKLDVVIQQTPKHECGAALLQLAERCLAANQWDRWSAAIDRVSAHTPMSDCSRYGSLLTMRMMASEELLAWQAHSSAPAEAEGDEGSVGPARLAGASKGKRLGSPQESDPFDSPTSANTTIATNTLVSNSITVQPAVNVQPANQPAVAPDQRIAAQPTIQTVSAEVAMSPQDAARISALKRAINEFNRISESDRALVARPDMQLAHFARRRALSELIGEPTPDTGSLQGLTTKSWLAGWPQVAAQEFIMAGGRAERPAWTARAARAQAAPALDGIADDACWLAGSTIELAHPFLPPVVSANGNKLTTQARFAYDEEFLYVFVSCPQVDGSARTADNTKVPRRYDMNLDGTDHFVLQVDTDRDYASSSELAINRSGHTYDRCCQYSQWNPRWYVATHESGSTWSAEFAIRLSDLTTRRPVVGSAWAFSAFRYVPNWGVQSWSQLRSTSPKHQGNGLLVFE